MDIEEKYKLAFDIIQRSGVDKDKEIVLSIADSIKNDRFFIETTDDKVILFLTWEDNLIDEKRYIFVNNLWIDPEFRKVTSLLKIKTCLKMILRNVYKFYWHNRQKDKMIYRS